MGEGTVAGEGDDRGRNAGGGGVAIDGVGRVGR